MPNYQLSDKELDAMVTAIGPELRDLDDQRVDLLARKQKNLWWSLAIFAVAALIAFALFRSRGAIGLVAVVGGALGLLLSHHLIIGDAAKDFQTNFKFVVVRTIAKHLHPEMEYLPQIGIAKEVFMQTQLFDTEPDRYSTEDQLAGRIGKTEVELAEVHAEERNDARMERATRVPTTWTSFVGCSSRPISTRTFGE